MLNYRPTMNLASFHLLLTLSGEWILRKFLRESGRLSWVEFIESGVESGAFSLLPCIVSNKYVNLTTALQTVIQLHKLIPPMTNYSIMHVIAIKLAVLYACVHDAYLVVNLQESTQSTRYSSCSSRGICWSTSGFSYWEGGQGAFSSSFLQGKVSVYIIVPYKNFIRLNLGTDC